MSEETSLNSEEIYNKLEQEILELTIKPGQVMAENDLCERFGVSRTPIRAVLRRLSHMGLVEITPYKSTQATLLSMKEINQMIYMRNAVEGAVLTDFTTSATPIIMEKLRYIIRTQEVLITETFELNQFYQLDSKLHEIWFKETGKLRLWELIRQSQVHYTRFRMLDILSAQQYPQIIEEHKRLFSCIQKKDLPGLKKTLEEHLYGNINRLEEGLKNELACYFKD